MSAFFASLFIKSHNDCISKGKSCQKISSKYRLPLPSCVHCLLNEADIGTNDVLVIGDVHGCLHELQEIISEAKQLTHDKCMFVFCGDVINKGPFSKDTLDFVRSLGSKAYVIRGNNEDRVLKHCLEMRENSNYILGLKAKYSWLLTLTDDDIEYLKELPYTITIPHLNAVAVHAGFNPWQPICAQNLDDMTNMRSISGVDNVCDVKAEADFKKGFPWASFWPGPLHVYFGHDARRGLQLYPYATGLDTGCVYGKKLTAKFLTGSKQYLTVDALMNYV